MSNEVKYYTQNVLYNFLYIFLASTVLQTFLLECGFAENTVNVYFSVMQIVQLSVMLIFSKKLDRVKNIIGVTAITYLPAIPFIIYLISMNKLGQDQKTMALLIVYVLSFVFNVGHSFYTILCYKLPYHIMDMKNYGKISARTGLIIGIVSVMFSYALTFFVDKYQGHYFTIMKFVYGFALLIIPLFFVVTRSMKKTGEFADESPKSDVKINIFTYKPFYVLFLPNLMRGFCMGITNLIVTIGYHEKVLDATSASMVLIILNVFTAVSCLLYSTIAKRLKEYRMIPLFSAGIALFLVLMFVVKGTTAFLVMYAGMYFCLNIVNYAIPVAVTQIVDYKVMGQYTSWRMLLNAGGIVIAGFVCTPMLEAVGAIAGMAITGGAMFIAGLVYYLFMRNNTLDKISINTEQTE